MGEAMRPQYALPRMANRMVVSSDVSLESEVIGADFGGLVKMFGRDQLGCQYPCCACGEMEEFARWGVVGSLRNERAISRASIDIAGIRRRRAEGDTRSREPSGSRISAKYKTVGVERI